MKNLTKIVPSHTTVKSCRTVTAANTGNNTHKALSRWTLGLADVKVISLLKLEIVLNQKDQGQTDHVDP